MWQNQKSKSERIHDWIGKAEVVHTGERKTRDSFSSSHGQASVQLSLGKQGSITTSSVITSIPVKTGTVTRGFFLHWKESYKQIKWGAPLSFPPCTVQQKEREQLGKTRTMRVSWWGAGRKWRYKGGFQQAKSVSHKKSSERLMSCKNQNTKSSVKWRCIIQLKNKRTMELFPSFN